jgi:hypothetical protein
MLNLKKPQKPPSYKINPAFHSSPHHPGFGTLSRHIWGEASLTFMDTGISAD